MRPISTSAYRGGTERGARPALAAVLVLVIAVVTVGGIPTSVLADAKETNAHHGSDATTAHQSQAHEFRSGAASNPNESTNQISVPQKRAVNPLLYNDLDYSSNSIARGGLWDDQDGSPPALAVAPGPPVSSLFPDLYGGGGRDGRLRNYDVLAGLLNAPPSQTFYNQPVAPSVSYPYMWGADRNKRLTGRNHQQRPMRLKRSPAKLTPADALSLLALLDSRNPYPSMSDYLPLAPANGPNDVLPYSPNSVYQDVPLSMALAQLGGRSTGSAGPLAPYGDDDGDWMNTWTDPAVDYLGFPLDVDTVSRLDAYGMKPTKNGIYPQKRFMITKRKRSVSPSDDGDDCKNGKKSCLLRKYGQLAASEVSSA